MSYLKFQHVFAGLMAVSGITAFVLPAQSVQMRVPGIEALFAPVSWPSGAIARWIHGKFALELSEDARSAELVKRENLELKNELANLYVRLDKIRQQEDYRREIGNIRPLCTPYSVLGTDSGPRATLLIQGSSLGSLRDGMPVLYPDGIVGQVQRVGIAGRGCSLSPMPASACGPALGAMSAQNLCISRVLTSGWPRERGREPCLFEDSR